MKVWFVFVTCVYQWCPYVHEPASSLQPLSWQPGPSWCSVLPDPTRRSSDHDPDPWLQRALLPKPPCYCRQPTDPLPWESPLIGPLETQPLWFHTDTHTYSHKQRTFSSLTHRYLLDFLLLFFKTHYIQTNTDSDHDRICRLLTTNRWCSHRAVLIDTLVSSLL